jgi:hypothetical protein
MAARIDLTLDCADPARLAAFWKLALGYEDEPRPPRSQPGRNGSRSPATPATRPTTEPGCTTPPGTGPG